MGFSLGNSALGPGAICENEVFVGVRLGRGVVLAQLGLVVFRAVFVGRSGGMLASAIDGFGFLGLAGFIFLQNRILMGVVWAEVVGQFWVDLLIKSIGESLMDSVLGILD